MARDPVTIHATCEDYRAGTTIDLIHDAADRGAAVSMRPFVPGLGSGRLGGSEQAFQ